jgi:apolipoprotein N-acyltransferase
VFDRWFDSYRWWWCALSGLLLVASFAPFSCATCGWIALVPAWWVITRSERVRRQPIRHGYLVGLIYFGGTFWWISNVTAIGAFFLVLYLALYPAIWFLFVARLVARPPGGAALTVILQALAAAALWVLLEWWRSWFLTGFNWNELGISQAPSIVFRQLAAFGGVHLISFVLVTVNILWAEGVLGIAKTVQEKRVVRPSVPFAAALLIVATCFALGWHHLQRHRGETPEQPLTYDCIQPNIPQIPYDGGPYINYLNAEKAALEKTENLSAEAILQPAKPDLLIWPEAFTGQEIFQSRPGLLSEIVREIASSSDHYFLLGSQESDVQHVYNTAYLFGPGWDTFQYYRKTRLVMLGEYIPFGNTFPWLHRAIGVGMDMTPGPGPKVFELHDPSMSFAPFICFEDTLPDVADKAARLHPDFFVTITNDGWYQGWCAAWGVRQHLSHAIFRCVEHDRPMIRCANTGISCQIDQDGTVVRHYTDASGAEIDVGGIFAGTLQPYPPHRTLYEMGGDWIVLISSLVSVMLGVRFFRRPDES